MHNPTVPTLDLAILQNYKVEAVYHIHLLKKWWAAPQLPVRPLIFQDNDIEEEVEPDAVTPEDSDPVV